MSRSLLHRAFASRRHHVSPFLVLGDPSPGLSLELAIDAVAAGATMVELGLPYSDPCADGPAVVAASRRAREAGVSTTRAFELLRAIASALPEIPRNLLVYANLVHARGVERFCDEAAAAGASSLLVPDLPFGEDALLAEACRASDLALVRMAGPATPRERLALLARDCDFVYVAGHQGITGAQGGADVALRAALLRRVREATPVPLALGFGLSSSDDVRGAFAAGAAIAVVGSHLARAIERGVATAAAAAAPARAPAPPSAAALRAAVRAEFAAAFAPLVPAEEASSCS